ncbi:histidine kinase N-terminal 7TM domain-containing diguanylate cyclase [Planobispora takensis]|uniref:GGDEF domain-containing protein n=1 Tax=Planobispora takensis TaxID=1367882 RepID=A0A8J3SZX3_9ACTN|nr:diguanylate cyclase [Planobispora takensis]GII02811.1 hypothetical protein Pta02_48190 [Planobispora takensis]
MGLPFLILLFTLATVTATGVAVAAWRRRATPALGIVALVASAIAMWSATEELTVLSFDVGVIRLLTVVKYLGVCGCMAGFLCLSKAVVDRTWRVPRRTLLLLTIEPALVTAAIVTNPWHYLFFTSAELAGAPEVRIPDFGPLFWVHAGYSYLLLGVGVTRLVRAWGRGPRFQRPLYGFALLSLTPSTVCNTIGLLGLVRAADITPIGFCATTTITYLVLVRRSLLELVPVAREQVFDVIGDAVMTVDLSHRILDLNAAADRMIRRMSSGLPSRLIGFSFTEPLGRLPLPDRGETDVTIVANGGIELNLRISALHDDRAGHVGWAIVARDVTALHRQRRELEAANARLEEQRSELERANGCLEEQRNELESANARLHEQLRTIEVLRADLAEQAVRDALTGLHNRRHLMEVLQREVARAAAEGSPLSVALLDVDHFKQVNDRHGHRAGDEVLVRFARLLTALAAAAGEGTAVARHGGEEFVIVFPGATGEQARARVDTLRERVAGEPVTVGGQELYVTFSAGVSAIVTGQNPDDLLHAADEALYAAKHGGRNRVELAAAPQPGAPSAAA